MERTFAAILAADVVEYSRHMRRDEEGTLERLRELRATAEDAIARHAGRLFGLAGDSFMAEFASPVQAVRCAVDLQARLRPSQPETPDDPPLLLRIGINLDDVMQDGENTYGDGVNIAARIMVLAPPGGIVVGRSVHDYVRTHLPLRFEDLGRRTGKNLAERIHVYRIVDGPAPKPRAARRRVLATAAVLGLALVVALAWPRLREHHVTSLSSIEGMAPNPPSPNSIAVLPFVTASLNHDPELDLLTDGLTEDIITDLSKIRLLLVIAEHSSSTFKGQDIAPEAAAAKLGVRFILDGTMRRMGQRLRVNAQLVDTRNGQHVWGDRWDIDPEGFFDVQDKVVDNIVRALALSLSSEERERIGQQDTRDLGAYKTFKRGWAHLLRQSPEGLAAALADFKAALQIDPNFTRAYAAIGQVYWNAWVWGWESSVGETWETAPSRADDYLKLAMVAPSAIAYQLAADVNLYARRFDEAVAFARQAIEYDPNDPVSHVKLAESLIYSGQPAPGLDSIHTAMRLDPFFRPYDTFVEGLALFGMDQFASAAPLFRRALERNPEDFAPAAPLAAALWRMGQQDEARAALETYKAGWPEANIEEIMIYWPFREEAENDRLTGPLRTMGLPEKLEE